VPPQKAHEPRPPEAPSSTRVPVHLSTGRARTKVRQWTRIVYHRHASRRHSCIIFVMHSNTHRMLSACDACALQTPLVRLLTFVSWFLSPRHVLGRFLHLHVTSADVRSSRPPPTSSTASTDSLVRSERSGRAVDHDPQPGFFRGIGAKQRPTPADTAGERDPSDCRPLWRRHPGRRRELCSSR